jgi:hypothetical protein
MARRSPTLTTPCIEGEQGMADEFKPATEATQQPQPAQQIQFNVDTSQINTTYTNWYRVTGTPEELILDFGLNPEMGQVPTEAIKLTQRLVMNFWTAKRLLSALHFAVQRHESFFGALEVDVQRRLRPGAGRPTTS